MLVLKVKVVHVSLGLTCRYFYEIIIFCFVRYLRCIVNDETVLPTGGISRNELLAAMLGQLPFPIVQKQDMPVVKATTGMKALAYCG